jgi:hypothetical protein
MLFKVHNGAFDPDAGDLEPRGEELWCGGNDDLSASVLTTVIDKLELGTWYKLEQFERLLAGRRPEKTDGMPSAITITQPGVNKNWATAIEVDEQSAALMLCLSVLEHAHRLRSGDDIWVRVE